MILAVRPSRKGEQGTVARGVVENSDYESTIEDLSTVETTGLEGPRGVDLHCHAEPGNRC